MIQTTIRCINYQNMSYESRNELGTLNFAAEPLVNDLIYIQDDEYQIAVRLTGRE